MRRRYRTARLQNIGDILQKILKRHRIHIRTEDQRLQKVWREAVGPKIAAYTRPDAVKRNVLFVKVANSVWMQQLHFLKGDILAKVNRSYEQDPIVNLFFSIDAGIAAKAERTTPPVPVREVFPLKARDKKTIEKSLAAVRDDDLRDILRRVMTREITRRRRMEEEARRPPGRVTR